MVILSRDYLHARSHDRKDECFSRQAWRTSNAHILFPPELQGLKNSLYKPYGNREFCSGRSLLYDTVKYGIWFWRLQL